MPTTTTTAPSRVRLDGPLAPYAEGFTAQLRLWGYAPGTVLNHLRRMARLSRWLRGRRLTPAALCPEMVDAFLARRPRNCTARSLAPLLGYLRTIGVVPAVERRPVARTPVDDVLGRYAEYAARERGLATSTIERNAGLVRPFLEAQLREDRLDLAALTAAEVIAFVLEESRQRPTGVPRLATALRSLLRFLHVDGATTAGLVEAVPPVAAWKQAGLPQALTTDQVEAMLASCDPDTTVGRRDLAILTVLSRLGLRVAEVAQLRLEDIDWRRGEITVTGSKDGRRERLPLPADVGRVVVEYLRHGRPTAAGVRALFLCARAPYRAMSRGAVTNVAARAAARVGLGTVHGHWLRHSAATAMLNAGSSLSEIGQVLRHRRARTTSIYLKVDTEGLRGLARPWPGSEDAA